MEEQVEMIWEDEVEERMEEARSWDFDWESTVQEWGSMVGVSEGERISREQMVKARVFAFYSERERERERGF